jgi:hypothetical protein
MAVTIGYSLWHREEKFSSRGFKVSGSKKNLFQTSNEQRQWQLEKKLNGG